MAVSGPKITLIGAASYFFGRAIMGHDVLPVQPEPIRLFDVARRAREMADA